MSIGTRRAEEGVLGPRAFREDELSRWGATVGAQVEPPLWVALYGPLGAGKSVLVRAICGGAGVRSRIPSPTFTLVRSYESARGFTIHHVDLFRLEPGDDLGPLGWSELLRSRGLVLVEWADRAGDQQPDDRWEMWLSYGARSDERRLEVRRLGRAPALEPW